VRRCCPFLPHSGHGTGSKVLSKALKLAFPSIRSLFSATIRPLQLCCDVCKRAGAYRLARLAVKYGAEILPDGLLVRYSESPGLPNLARLQSDRKFGR
jgi:hypothetical protein